jgi:acyl transferase domain-containing protein
MSSRAPLDIAVVGMGGIFPGAPDLTRFFENVLAGADLVMIYGAVAWDRSKPPTQAVSDFEVGRVEVSQ